MSKKTISKKALSELSSYKSIVNIKYRSQVDRVIDLYKSTKIPNIRTVFKILDGLSSRGKGPEVALDKIKKYSNNETIVEKIKNNVTLSPCATAD